VIVILAVLPIVLFATSFVGGFGGAIAAGGREDRSLLQNAAIGAGAWAIAFLIHLVVADGEPFELTIGSIVVALVAAVIIARILDRRARTNRPDPTAGGSAP
jgi:hypothetical protein